MFYITFVRYWTHSHTNAHFWVAVASPSWLPHKSREIAPVIPLVITAEPIALSLSSLLWVTDVDCETCALPHQVGSGTTGDTST